jgi:hypothetical protein
MSYYKQLLTRSEQLSHILQHPPVPQFSIKKKVIPSLNMGVKKHWIINKTPYIKNDQHIRFIYRFSVYVMTTFSNCTILKTPRFAQLFSK